MPRVYCSDVEIQNAIGWAGATRLCAKNDDVKVKINQSTLLTLETAARFWLNHLQEKKMSNPNKITARDIEKAVEKVRFTPQEYNGNSTLDADTVSALCYGASQWLVENKPFDWMKDGEFGMCGEDDNNKLWWLVGRSPVDGCCVFVDAAGKVARISSGMGLSRVEEKDKKVLAK